MNACEKCVFAVHDNKPHCGLRGFRSDFNVERCSAENNTVPNGYELQEDGYFSWVKKKKEYPKTYDKCCEVLGIGSYFEPEIRNATTEECHKFTKLIRLKRCRDAYWKLYGEDMGLGKPWEPDWTNEHQVKYTIYTMGDDVIRHVGNYIHAILAFPTSEMRDAFKENFDPDIEICKIFL